MKVSEEIVIVSIMWAIIFGGWLVDVVGRGYKQHRQAERQAARYRHPSRERV